MAANNARRRYERMVLFQSVGYAFALFLCVGYFGDHPGARRPLAYLVAVAPAVPILMIFAALGRYFVEEKDEYLRLLIVRQALIATSLTLSVATVWGFLEDFGLAPHAPAYYAAVLWFGGLGLGTCVSKLVERRAA